MAHKEEKGELDEGYFDATGILNTSDGPVIQFHKKGQTVRVPGDKIDKEAVRKAIELIEEVGNGK